MSLKDSHNGFQLTASIVSEIDVSRAIRERAQIISQSSVAARIDDPDPLADVYILRVQQRTNEV